MFVRYLERLGLDSRDLQSQGDSRFCVVDFFWTYLLYTLLSGSGSFANCFNDLWRSITKNFRGNFSECSFEVFVFSSKNRFYKVDFVVSDHLKNGECETIKS